MKNGRFAQPDSNTTLPSVFQSDAIAQALLESVSEGIVIVDRQGRIVLVNARAESMFGYQREHLVGQDIQILVPERLRDAHRRYCADSFAERLPRMMGTRGSLVGRRQDGTEFPADISLRFVEAEGQSLALGFVTDITERQHMQEALQKYSERLEHRVEERTQQLRQAHMQFLAEQRLQQDLELARQVQASLLPRSLPALDGYEFAAMALPARYVSGDVYDFVLSDAQACHLVLADISGQGVPAALLASTARTLVRAEIEHEDSPAAILTSVNSSLFSELDLAELFVTFFVARLDANSGRLSYANAGHTEALWWQQARGGWQTLSPTGLPVGIFADTAIGEETIVLRPGDRLVFYSDGVTEACNEDDEFFGVDRLVRVLSDHMSLSASDLVRTITDAIGSFCYGAEYRGIDSTDTEQRAATRDDDLTLIVLRVLPRTVSFVYPATLEHLDEAVALIRQEALAYGDRFAYEVELASSEVITNIMQHACGFCGEVRGEITLLPDRIAVDLYDQGVACDLSTVPEPELDELHEGGYGLYVARQLLDELTYARATPDGNHWRLVKICAQEV